MNHDRMVWLEARRLAKQATKASLRRKGYKLTAFTLADISKMAGDYLLANKAQLVDEARANIKQFEQRKGRCSNKQIPVQQLGAK